MSNRFGRICLDTDIATVRPKSIASSTAIIEVQIYIVADFTPQQANPLEWWN